jgi:type I restriction enzyme S subunit
MTWDLADGWNWQPLRHAVTPARNQIAPDSIDSAILYVGLEHVASGSGEYSGVPAGEAGLKSAKFQFSAGDLLYGKLRPNLRKCVVAQEDGVCSTDLVPLRPHFPEAAEFLAMQMRSQPFTDQVMRMIGGANLPRVSVKDLLTVRVGVPPPHEQQRLFDAVAASRALRSSLRSFERSVLDLDLATTAWVIGLPGAGPAASLRASLGS